jgi:DNA-binding NarL/FixJ family response regulator
MKILIVDDHPALRGGVRQRLELRPDFTVVGECGSAAETLRRASELAPDVIILDLHLPDGSGIDLAGRLRDLAPAVKIVVFSGDADPDLVTAALRAGARGYVLKQVFLDDLIRAIDSVAAGKIYVCPEASAGILAGYGEPAGAEAGPPKPELSDRERQMVRLVAEGRRNKEVAAELGLSGKSVEAQRARLMKKLNCSSIAELVRYAIREGIVAL